MGLLWDKVDFERRRIIVSRTRDRYGLKETTKTGKVREVPMNQPAHDVLLKLKKSSTKSDLNFVFQNETGDSVSLMHLNNRFFKKAIDRAGVRKIRFHDLRSTYASNFVMNGGNLFTLSKILGHSSVVMTEKRYAHLSNEYIGKSADIVNFSSDSPKIALAIVSDV